MLPEYFIPSKIFYSFLLDFKQISFAFCLNKLLKEVNIQTIVSQIYYIRGTKVILDLDLAVFYEVELRILNQSVKRNILRFPEDFMFQLNDSEWTVIQRPENTVQWGGRRTLPYAFSEQGVAMLSGILRSEKAIQINIMIMRAFVRMREMIDQNKELKARLIELESKYDQQFQVIFDALKKIIYKENEPRKPIGF